MNKATKQVDKSYAIYLEELRRLCAGLRQGLTQARKAQSRLAVALVSDLT